MVSIRRQHHGPSSSAMQPTQTKSTSPEPEPQKSRTNHSNSHHATPVVRGIPLISLRQVLSDRFRSIFPYELFNAVQSKCFESVYRSNDNVVIAAPTGSGKTAILELAMCKLANDRVNQNFKIVYQAPTKALCSERARDWQKKFTHMNLQCAELTGDTSQAEMKRVGNASIIVTTPEKWDSVTRKWQDHRKLLQMVELFLIDEVHILKDARGATLEAVVSRMKAIGANVRFVALSATVPNSEDIATWLGRNHTDQHLPAHRETFGEEWRPVQLQKFVYGYQFNGHDFAFDHFLDQKLLDLLRRHGERKPILIFCFTRKSCETTAANLVKELCGLPDKETPWKMPSTRISVLSRELQELVKFGVAFHHAGLDIQDRMAIEKHFLNGDLSVICCTSTLAVGVNLPCHTVVLKGTCGFAEDKIVEYSDLEVMQMLGRAGRPQFDKSAIGIILTRMANKERYEKMVSGQQVLESTLHRNLIEHLNSEVCLRTIYNLASAKKWLASTFLSVRLRRNPVYYQLTQGAPNTLQLEDRLGEICERDIKELRDAGLISGDDTIKATEYGLVMSRYMVAFPTMKLLMQIPRGVRMEALITILSQATEFKDFRMKPAERPLFREINKSTLTLYPIKENVTATHHKVSLMIQFHLGGDQFPDSSDAAKVKRQLMVEKKLIFERLSRLVRAVADCKGHERDGVGTGTALELARAVSAEAWEGRPAQLLQVPNIGPVGMRKLVGKDIRSIHELAAKDADEIERLMSRQPPFGKKMKDALDKFPRLSLDVSMMGHKLQPSKEDPVVINVRATCRYLNQKGPPNWHGRPPPITFFAESTDGSLVHFWRGTMRKVDKELGLQLNFSAPLRKFDDYLVCHFSCEEIVGTAVSRILKHGLSHAAFPARTASRPVSSCRPAKQASTQEYLDDGIMDGDLMDAADQAQSACATQSGIIEVDSDYDNYPPIEDMLEIWTSEREPNQEAPSQQSAKDCGGQEDDMEVEQEVDREPVQMWNGKWQCNHACSGGTFTKAGKICTHRCCKEGIDKPRKARTAKAKKRKADDMEGEDEIEFARAHAETDSAAPSTSQDAAPQAERHKKPSNKRPISRSKPEKTASAKAAKPILDTVVLDDFDVDFIDLTSKEDRLAPQSAAMAAKKQVHNRATSKGTSSGGALNPNRSNELSKTTAQIPTPSASLSAQSNGASDFDDLVILDGDPFLGSVPLMSPFKEGHESARDEVLCQGVSPKFSGTGREEDSEQLGGAVDFASGSCAAMPIPLNDDPDHGHFQLRSPPDWEAELQDLGDPDLISFLRDNIELI
ncbi:hypothetical protein QBC46DRAFT_434685 [Diplogelasinospora grovesii]|uniref:DNA 3'-5' helicase n=1 Tax=Diplogelasinospora grovesii TaxID=303347 RepID=A0AAN6N913_9PEZI|nr:hypothetical protein QBC46DRAFT_434685 [Diplogelasinospora grovesii]